jgi:hypothetical protein
MKLPRGSVGRFTFTPRAHHGESGGRGGNMGYVLAADWGEPFGNMQIGGPSPARYARWSACRSIGGIRNAYRNL